MTFIQPSSRRSAWGVQPGGFGHLGIEACASHGEGSTLPSYGSGPVMAEVWDNARPQVLGLRHVWYGWRSPPRTGPLTPQRPTAVHVCASKTTICGERNRFELGDTPQSGHGPILRLSTVEASPHLAGTEPPVSTEIVVMALFERAQRQNGLCPCQAPVLAFALHPVLDHGTTGRLHDAGPHGQARGQVHIVLHPAPVVVEERDDFLECFSHRLPELPLRQALSQAADDVSHPASQTRRQLVLDPTLSRLRCVPEQGIGRAPEVAYDVH